MFTAIAQHTPAWVWAVLAALTAAGLSQLRARELTLRRATIVPLVLLALSASGTMAAFGRSPLAVGAWFAGVALALCAGRTILAPRGATWSAQRALLRVPGSALPLALMLGLFALKFLVGTLLSMHPALAADPAFCGGFALTYGLFAGVFLGRSLVLHALARGPGGLLAA